MTKQFATTHHFLSAPSVVVVWLVVEVLFFVIPLFLPMDSKITFFNLLAFVPERDWGHGGVPWSMITYSLLHYDIGHLVWNLTFGLVFAKMVYMVFSDAPKEITVKRRVGAIFWWGLVYVGAVIGGALFHLFALGSGANVGLLGASAGIEGWLGASLAFALFAVSMPPPFDNRAVALVTIIFFVAINFLTALVYNYFTTDVHISNAGHLGGLVVGFVLGVVWWSVHQQ